MHQDYKMNGRGRRPATMEPSPQILVVPYPAQGHINPILDLAKCISSKGVRITLILTTKTTESAILPQSPSSLSYFTIPDDSQQPPLLHSDNTIDLQAHFDRFRSVVSANLVQFIDQKWGNNAQGKEDYPRAMVYDAGMPWLLEVAKEKGMMAAPFSTRCGGVNAVCYHLNKGSLVFPYEKGSLISLPCLPDFESTDLVRLPEEMDPRGDIVRFLANQFTHLENADWVFFNTFHPLESEVLNWLGERYPKLKTIGPTFLLPHTDSLNNTHLINLADPKQEAYTEWLNSKHPNSVVYVSFGSVVPVGNEQREELAYGLMMSNCNFLWVVRDTEVDKLPKEINNSEKGLIINWCYQPGVLTHPALSCFMTHCGWNSTLEALSTGVPLIAMAQWTDQVTNAKLIEDVWGVGIRLRRGNNKVIGREEIAMCVEEMVRGEKGVELKKNSMKWKVLAHESVQKGGSSLNNVDEFVQELITS